MKDMGHTPEEAKPSETRKTKSYPTLYLNDKELPCLKGCKLGNKMKLMAQIEVVGARKRQEGGFNYDLEIKKMGEMGEMKMDEAMDEATKD